MEFKFTLEEVQRMSNYLSEFPYKEVADIIDNIKKQYNEQNTEQ